MKRIPPFLIVLTASILACNLPIQASPTSSPPPTGEPAIPPLTAARLMNAEYRFSNGGTEDTYRLVDGQYQQGTDPSSEDYVSIHLEDMMAFGDLNGDGVEDAAVIVTKNYYVTSIFFFVAAMLNQDGAPLQADMALIGDQPQIRALSIVGGNIVVDSIVHSADDPACCPSFSTEQTFFLMGSDLLGLRRTSLTPDGQLRAVSITAPDSGTVMSGVVTVSGSVTIAPSGNNLLCIVFDQDGNEVYVSGVPVAAPGPGLPGTFSFDLDPAAIAASGTLRVTLADMDFATGFDLALDTVLLLK
ncbi:MAG: hypothetical protein FJZ96_08525 [Chloroflexi bacterium]|nr:hypothetical protein [Chloroflexota bacterium]